MTNIDHRRMAEALTDEFLTERLAAAGNPPGLRQATVDLATDAFAQGHVEQLMRQQSEQLRHPNSTAVPDAYLADEAAIENALQRAAAGMRTASAQHGSLSRPLSFERGAAQRLSDDPRLALHAELARIPRPSTRPEPLLWTLEPAPWTGEQETHSPWPPHGLDATSSQRCLTGGTAAFARIDSGPHLDWVQIALIERHATPARSYPETPRREVFVALCIEVADQAPPPSSFPVALADWRLWMTRWRPPNASAQELVSQLATIDTPLAALADNGHGSPWLRNRGPGAPPFVLVPAAPLIIVFGLKPTPGVCGFSLSDATGPALISRHWRGHPVHDGNYQPLFPAVEGTDLILRPDLFTRLTAFATEPRIHAGITAFCVPDGSEET